MQVACAPILAVSEEGPGRAPDLAARFRPEGLKSGFLLRKEVIQPQVPLRLPCYDFIPVTGHTLGTFLPCGLVQ